MKPWQQASILSATVLTMIFLILAAADTGMMLTNGAQRCTLQFPKWFGCVLANHEGLAGGLIGGGGALISAWIAWRAIMDQIAVGRSLATIKEDATYEAIRIELEKVADVIWMLWRVVDAALAKNREPRQAWRDNGRAVLLAIYPGKGSLTGMLDNQLASDLDPIRRKQFARMAESLKWLCEMIENRNEDRLWLENIRTMLTHFNNYLHQFDPKTGRKFKDRTKTNVDARGYSAHLEPSVDQFERTGNLN